MKDFKHIVDAPRRKTCLLIISAAFFCLLSCNSAGTISGRYEYSDWDGRHGHTSIIRIGSKRLKKVDWGTNFNMPTRMGVSGPFRYAHDTIFFRPKKVRFYTRVARKGQNRSRKQMNFRKKRNFTWKKRACLCSDDYAEDFPDEENQILNACEEIEFRLSGDTLSEWFGAKHVRK